MLTIIWVLDGRSTSHRINAAQPCPSRWPACAMASCALGELQEVCHRPAPCNWGGTTACLATMRPERICPASQELSLGASVLGPLLTSPSDVYLVAAAVASLFLGPLILVVWRCACHRWTAPPQKLALPTDCVLLCAAGITLVAAFAALAPADVWGGCEERVCVYHSMFCEHTRHTAAVRHPANFWSNLPYLFNGLVLCRQAWSDLRARTSRSFALLDGCFGLVSLIHRWRVWRGVCRPDAQRVTQCVRAHPRRGGRPTATTQHRHGTTHRRPSTCPPARSFASFAWHGSNCTALHFVDIGLMNCVIVFFPLRFGAMALASLTCRTDRALSVVAAAVYPALCAALLRGALELTPLYHEAFPTGSARSDLTVGEVAAIVAFPALYPLPSWLVVALRRRWGSNGAMWAQRPAPPRPTRSAGPLQPTCSAARPALYVCVCIGRGLLVGVTFREPPLCRVPRGRPRDGGSRGPHPTEQVRCGLRAARGLRRADGGAMGPRSLL